MILKNIVNIFNSEFNYPRGTAGKNINEHSPVKLRNSNVQLRDIILYKFLYSCKGKTKDGITSTLNNLNKYNLSRQNLEAKENKIPIKIYPKGT